MSPTYAGRRVFVIDPYLPNGGTYMAYHVARIFQEEFGFTAVAVSAENGSPDNGIFRYDPIFPQVSVDEMERMIGPRDVLQANAGHSRFVFGPRLPGRKIMYVQSFTTAAPLDCSFDAFVSVSPFVQQYLSTIYGVAAPVIPPFIDPEQLAPSLPWDERPPGSIITHAKGFLADVNALQLAMRRQNSAIDLSSVLAAGSRFTVSQTIGAARYLISVPSAEGFGLIPLEAMAVGTTVVGFDGYGGRAYMADGMNCACTSYGDFDGLAERIITAIENPDLARRMAEAGRDTAARYHYARFRAAWCEEIAKFLNVRY